MMGHSTCDGAHTHSESELAYVTRPRRTAANVSLFRTKTASAKRALGENAEAAIGGGGGRRQRLAARISGGLHEEPSASSPRRRPAKGDGTAGWLEQPPSPNHLRTTTTTTSFGIMSMLLCFSSGIFLGLGFS